MRWQTTIALVTLLVGPAAAQSPAPAAEGAGLLRLASSTTPFRLDRQPPTVRYGLPAGPPAPPPPPRPPKPVLQLTGIVWGAEPAAIVEGVPGIEGPSVFAVGQIVGGLRLTRLEKDGAKLAGMDTTWVLKVRMPW